MRPPEDDDMAADYICELFLVKTEKVSMKDKVTKYRTGLPDKMGDSWQTSRLFP